MQNSPKENHQRIVQEINLFKKHNMISMLKTMKYIVDTLRSNNVIWGVGRGSSVASYVLHIIGVHKIDSVKYNLPIEEFFKGEK
jgi:DNA polymerase III alpha subunit